MNFIKPIGILLLFIIVAFLLRNQISPNVNSSLEKLPSVIKEKVEDNLLPPPLQHLANVGSAPKSGAITASGIIEVTNNERRNNGNLGALNENVKLDAAASAKVQDMFAIQYFEHTSPSGKGPADLARAVSYSYVVIGENLALGNFANNNELLNAWMNSPGHRANILNSRFTEIGAAAAIGDYKGQKVWLAVQEFGRPLSSCPSPDAGLRGQIENDKNRLAVKESNIQSAKQDLDNSTPKYGEAYNSKAESYNRMVTEYNSDLQSLKVEINTYNQQVNTFNNCVES